MTSSLKNQFECIPIWTEPGWNSQKHNFAAWIVTENACHVPYCIIKLGEDHPFHCVSCFLGQTSAECEHVTRVREDNSMHLNPPQVPSSRAEIESLVRKLFNFEIEYMGEYDDDKLTALEHMMYEFEMGFKPDRMCFDVVNRDLFLKCKDQWTEMHNLYMLRQINRTQMKTLLRSKHLFSMLTEDMMRSSVTYNINQKKLLASISARDEIMAELYLVDADDDEDKEYQRSTQAIKVILKTDEFSMLSIDVFWTHKEILEAPPRVMRLVYRYLDCAVRHALKKEETKACLDSDGKDLSLLYTLCRKYIEDGDHSRVVLEKFKLDKEIFTPKESLDFLVENFDRRERLETMHSDIHAETQKALEMEFHLHEGLGDILRCLEKYDPDDDEEVSHWVYKRCPVIVNDMDSDPGNEAYRIRRYHGGGWGASGVDSSDDYSPYSSDDESVNEELIQIVDPEVGLKLREQDVKANFPDAVYLTDNLISEIRVSGDGPTNSQINIPLLSGVIGSMRSMNAKFPSNPYGYYHCLVSQVDLLAHEPPTPYYELLKEELEWMNATYNNGLDFEKPEEEVEEKDDCL